MGSTAIHAFPVYSIRKLLNVRVGAESPNMPQVQRNAVLGRFISHLLAISVLLACGNRKQLAPSATIAHVACFSRTGV
jgi:hypothetical protein